MHSRSSAHARATALTQTHTQQPGSELKGKLRLLVSLPSACLGGKLVVSDCVTGKAMCLDEADADGFDSSFCCFYLECNEELETVTAGNRLLLEYFLYEPEPGETSKELKLPSLTVPTGATPQHFRNLASLWLADDTLCGGKLCYGLEQNYPGNLDWKDLKDRDARIAQALINSGAYDLHLVTLAFPQDGGADSGICVQGWLAPDGFQLPKAALQAVRNLLIFQDEMMHKGPLKQCTATTGIVIWPKRQRAAIFGAEVACHMLMDALHGDTQALEGFVDEQDLRKDYVEAVSKESFEDWPGESAFGGLLVALADRWLPLQTSADDFLEFLEQIKFGEQELSASTESLLVKVLAHFELTTEVGHACTEVYKSKLLVSEQTAGICCNTLRFFCSSPLILAARKGKAFLEELAGRFVTSLQHRPKESKEAEDHSELQIKTITTLLSVLTSNLPSEQLLEQTCSAVVSNKTRYVRARLHVLIRTCARDVHESIRCASLLNNVSFKQHTRLRQV